jgi:hypothetical protein
MAINLKITTEFVHPPIAVRLYDWCATFEDYDGERESPIGWGITEQQAIEDLKMQVEE